MIPISILETLDGTTDVTPAALLSYSDIQTHLKLDGSADQTIVEAMISAATKLVENYIDRKLVTQHWSVYFDWFPSRPSANDWWDGVRDGAVSTLTSSNAAIELPFGPCQSISYVRAYDETDGTTLVDASNYSVDNKGPIGRIALRSGGVWPSVTLRPVNGVHVRGVFGMGSASIIPHDIKHAVKMAVSEFYEHRGDAESKGLPLGVQILLEPYRRWKLR